MQVEFIIAGILRWQNTNLGVQLKQAGKFVHSVAAAFFDYQQSFKSNLDLDYVPGFLHENVCAQIREAKWRQ